MEIAAKGCIRSEGEDLLKAVILFHIIDIKCKLKKSLLKINNSRSNCRIIERVYIKFGTEGGDGQHKY